MDNDITNLVERIEEFEERLGIRIDGLYASSKRDNYIIINGEIHPREGKQITHNIELVASAHDFQGRVLHKSSVSLQAESFYGFETFSIILFTSPGNVSKIRIYPKSS